MARRKKRAIFFVCSSLIEEKIKSENIEASSKKEASNLFMKKMAVMPETINGPFYFKKIKIPKLERKDLKFSNITRKAIYKNYNTTAFILTDPPNSAYLVFNSMIDGEICPKMNTTVIVPLEELQFT